MSPVPSFPPRAAAGAHAAGCAVAELADMIDRVRALPAAADDAERIDRLRHFEQLKSAIAAAQLLEGATFETSQRSDQAVAGLPTSRQGRGIAAQVALARRTSPHHAARWLGWAKVLTRELPITFEALSAGLTSEWRALIMARETVWLSREDRAEVDRIVGPQLHALSDARVEAEATRHAQRLDPAGAAERRRVALRERRVTVRPRPDTMSCLSATTSVERGVAAWAALRRAADTLIGTGDPLGRTRDQIMADLLVERVTGQSTAGAVDVHVEVIIDVDSLLDSETANDTEFGPGRSEADLPSSEKSQGFDRSDAHRWRGPVDVVDIGNDRARIQESPESFGAADQAGVVAPADESDMEEGRDRAIESALLTVDGIAPIPIPATLARQLISRAPHARLRRLFAAPRTGQLIAMESRHRDFPAALRDFIRYRDQYCSTPHCGAAIRHIDHALPAEAGGATSAANGNGKCAGCNWAKQAPGWFQTQRHGGRGILITPTGHRYDLGPPRAPVRQRRPDYSPLVDQFWNNLRAS